MNTNEFDDHMRAKLQDYKSPVDAQATWTGVQAKMNPGGRKVGAFWWTGGIFLLLSLAGAGWYALSGNEAIGMQNKYMPRTSENALPATETSDESFTNLLGSLDPTEAQDTEEMKFGLEDAPETRQLAYKNQMALSTDPAQIYSKTLSEQGAENASNIPASASPGEINSPTSEYFERSALAKAIRQSSTEDFSAFNSFSEREIAHIDNAHALDFMAMRPLSDLKRESAFPFLTEGPDEDYFKPENKRGPTLTLLADAGIGVPGRNLEAVSPVWNTYTEERLRTEIPLESAAAQLRLSLEFLGKWYFTTGLSFTRINERFAIDRITTDQELVQYISHIHIHESGDTTLTYGTGVVTTEHHEKASHINRYTFFDIPVTAGYIHRFGPWSLGIEGGIMVNLSLQSTGSMLHSEGPVVRLENSGMFHSNLGISYTGGLRLGYQPGIRTMFYIQPGIRHIPGSLMEQDIQRQTYTLYGVSAGMAYRLK